MKAQNAFVPIPLRMSPRSCAGIRRRQTPPRPHCAHDAIFLGCGHVFSSSEVDVRHQTSIRRPPTASVLVILGIIGGCHQAKSPVATSADVEVAQHEARQEVEQARLEARKDVKSAAKVMGANSRDVAAARVTGTFDMAMTRADGDHKVAIEKCMTLELSAQQSCKAQADVDYQTAAASAKAIRISPQQ